MRLLTLLSILTFTLCIDKININQTDAHELRPLPLSESKIEALA